MNEILNDDQKKKIMTDIIKSLRFESMVDAKDRLYWLIHHSEIENQVSFNTLMHLVKHERLSYGNDWGWKNLRWDILSNKYGAAVIYNQKTKRTEFVLHLPPVKKIEEPYKPKHITVSECPYFCESSRTELI